MLSPAKIDLTILLLTLNEEAAIGGVIHRITETIKNLNCSAELLVVDGASTDRTVQIASEAGARVITQRRFGYGGALIEGIQASRGEYLLTLDVDGSHPPELIESMWSKRFQADIIIGSRFVSGGSTGGPKYRQLLSKVLSDTFPRILSIPVRDVSSGYRLYRRACLAPERYGCENFAVLLEILVLAFAEGYSLQELPLRYEPRKGGVSHAQVLRFGLDYLSMVLRLWKLRNSVESADYDHRAYDSIIPLQRYWQRQRRKIVTHFVRGVSGQILDIGCGTSRIIQNMPNSLACDFSFRKLRYLKSTNRLRINASTFALPIRSESCDGLIHSQVIEHIPFDPVIFFELNRVLKINGTLVCGTPDYGRPWWPITEFFYQLLLPNAYADEHITHYTKATLTAILAECGFRCLEARYICGGELIIKAQKVEHLDCIPTTSVRPKERNQ